MHTRLKEEFDADRESYVGITDYLTEQNRYEIHCRSCNKTLFADIEASETYNHAMEQGLDSPFTCAACGLDNEEFPAER